MKCFFHGSNLHEDKLVRNRGLISFAIPDYGVLYRSQYEGNCYECEYASGILLIRFIQLNQDHFKQKKLTLLTDSPIVVYQVHNRIAASKTLEKSRDLFLFYKRRLGFELTWIPASMNKAEMSLLELGVNTQTPKFNYSIFEEGLKKRDLNGPQGNTTVKVT